MGASLEKSFALLAAACEDITQSGYTRHMPYCNSHASKAGNEMT